MARATALVLVFMLLVPLSAFGTRSYSTAAQPVLSTLLPKKSDFALNSDWTRLGNGQPYFDERIFTESASASYAGSVGSWVLVVAFRHDGDPLLIGPAWTEMSQWRNAIMSSSVALDPYDRRDEDSHQAPFPKGVIAADRSDGYDAWSFQTVGVGIYAFQSNVMALIVVSGRIHPDVHRTGVDAIDYVASLIATRSGAA